MRSIKYLWVLLPVMLLAACNGPKPPEPPPCKDKITQDWKVDEYTVEGQDQSITNVTVSFTGDKYTLRLPEITEFGSTGTWTTNEDCSKITLDDGSNQLVLTTDLSDEGRMVLTFARNNFKEASVSYRIVLVSNS